MCKISWGSLHYNLDESRMKFPSNLNYNGKIVCEIGPWSVHVTMPQHMSSLVQIMAWCMFNDKPLSESILNSG